MIMKTRFIATSFFFLSLACSSFAETFLMKDGTTMEGTILSETPESYIIEVNVTKSIKDERTIAKADVEKVQRDRPDLTAFEEIEKLSPTPDFLTADEYARRIRKVETFLKVHMGSSKSKEAKAILATLKSEANEVLAGGIKINGKIVPPAEYRSNMYDLDARIHEAKIRTLVKHSMLLHALRSYQEFDSHFRSTTINAQIIPLMIQVIHAYLAEIEQSASTFTNRARTRELGLQRMPASDRHATAQAIAEENAALERQFKKEKNAKIGWVTTHPFFKPALDDALAYGKQELTRLNAMKSAPTVDGGKIFRDAMSKIQTQGNAAAVSAAIASARAANISQKYISILEATAQTGR